MGKLNRSSKYVYCTTVPTTFLSLRSSYSIPSLGSNFVSRKVHAKNAFIKNTDSDWFSSDDDMYDAGSGATRSITNLSATSLQPSPASTVIDDHKSSITSPPVSATMKPVTTVSFTSQPATPTDKDKQSRRAQSVSAADKPKDLLSDSSPSKAQSRASIPSQSSTTFLSSSASTSPTSSKSAVRRSPVSNKEVGLVQTSRPIIYQPKGNGTSLTPQQVKKNGDGWVIVSGNGKGRWK
jgi:hypothetical protein